jgi:hypothetical protein
MSSLPAPDVGRLRAFEASGKGGPADRTAADPAFPPGIGGAMDRGWPDKPGHDVRRPPAQIYGLLSILL